MAVESTGEIKSFFTCLDVTWSNGLPSAHGIFHLFAAASLPHCVQPFVVVMVVEPQPIANLGSNLSLHITGPEGHDWIVDNLPEAEGIQAMAPILTNTYEVSGLVLHAYGRHDVVLKRDGIVIAQTALFAIPQG